MAADKDTIYVDIDDEITTIIDKVRGSDAKIVALVLPKRASVFQSVVNMKLLKRAAEVAKKHVVLVTTEANLMPLAGSVGLHVASTPQSKPEIPQTSVPSSLEDQADETVNEEEYTADNAGDRPIGELAQATGHVAGVDMPEEAVTLEDEAPEDAPKKLKLPKNPHLRVPNFNRFRLALFLGGLGLVVLVAGLYVCIVVLPKAAIAITTNSSDVNVSLSPTLDTAAQKLDTVKLVLPAKSEQQQKTTSQQVDATGQKNNGDAAIGTVTMSATACFPHIGTPNNVPAGTGVSTNGLTFITQKKATFNYTGNDGSGCNYYTTNSIDITAQTGGAKYNINNATFTVAGRSDVTATGSTSGGTDDITKVVSQTDIDNAKQKLSTQDTSAVKASLEQALRTDGMYPLTATFNAGTPVITTSSNVGDQADTVTVTQAVTYTMYGAKKADLDALIEGSVGSQIDTKAQSILNDGLDTATINVTNTSGSTVQLSLETTATVGPDINADSVKKQAAGKQAGDVKALVDRTPGVTSVDVQFSPFWVSTVPSNLDHVTVTISKAH